MNSGERPHEAARCRGGKGEGEAGARPRGVQTVENPDPRDRGVGIQREENGGKPLLHQGKSGNPREELPTAGRLGKRGRPGKRGHVKIILKKNI